MIEDSERPTETHYETHTVSTNMPREPDMAMEAMEPKTYQQKKAVYRSYHIIWFIVGLIVALLGFRFVFELLAANPANSFVQMIYTLSYPFAGPFRTIFGVTNVAYSLFDWSILVAIVVYVLIGYALVQLLRIIRPVTPQEVNHPIRTV